MMPLKIMLSFFMALVLFNCNVATAQNKQNTAVTKKASVADKFYAARNTTLFWYSADSSVQLLRAKILRKADSAQYYGLRREDYRFPANTGKLPADQLMQAERQFTQALINLSTDIYQGAGINNYISNDEISGLFKPRTDSFILSWLMRITANELHTHFASLEPTDSVYNTLKGELKRQTDSGNSRKVAELTASINLHRWIRHFNFDKFIVVNIPAATLRLIEQDTIKLTMKVVVGKPATRTPRFSSWCNKVILYPYWNVPPGIARKELLPKFKKSPSAVKAMDMQIINSAGKIVNPHSLNWAAFNRNYFPYTIRQCTGCDNALGVIKFNLTDPFNVYMHDTNYKLAFLSEHRYLSHGCIRVSNPIALGNELLDNKLDSNFLQACINNQEPVSLDIKKPIPVFVIYMTAAADGCTVVYWKDVYKLNK